MGGCCSNSQSASRGGETSPKKQGQFKYEKKTFESPEIKPTVIKPTEKYQDQIEFAQSKPAIKSKATKRRNKCKKHVDFDCESDH